MALDSYLTAALEAIAAREQVPVSEILTLIDTQKPSECPLASAVRVFILSYFRRLGAQSRPPTHP